MGLAVWLAILLAPAAIGLPYELWTLLTGREPPLTEVARRFVSKYPGPAVVLAAVYGGLWGLLLGHLFL